MSISTRFEPLETYPTQLWSTNAHRDWCKRIACAASGLTWLSAARRNQTPNESGGLLSHEDGFRSYETGPGASLIALDADGAVRHSLDGMALVTCLPDGTILAVGPGELLRIDDPTRPPTRRRAIADGVTILVHRDRVAVKNGDCVIVLSHELAELAAFNLPGWEFYRVSADGIFWAAGDRILRCDWSGSTAEIARIPVQRVCAEIRRALPECFVESTHIDHAAGRTSTARVHVADRPENLMWSVTPDADDQLLFACNRWYGFTVVCFTRAGEPLWVRCLSHGCCGYRVQRLNSGVLVASSGCGGTVSWFDAAGNVLAQSASLLGPGLSGIISSDLLIDNDDSVYVRRVDGHVLALDASGRLRWELSSKGLSPMQLDRTRRRLLCVREVSDECGESWSHVDAWALPQSQIG